MLIGIKDIAKLFAISIVTCCAAFVCTLFLNYNNDIAGIKDEITDPQGMVMYDAQVATGKVVAGIAGGCRPVSYVGFVIGTVYQYLLLRIMVDIVFADFESMPEFNFNFEALAVSAVTFIAAYEIILYCYSRKINGQSVKSIMLE